MKKNLVLLTGAGIDQESGVQTFRDIDGTWANYNVNDVCTIGGWRRNPELVLEFYNTRRKELDTVEPNDAHKLLATLESDYDVHVVTQNVTDLHERGGSTDVTHLHGELRKMRSTNNPTTTYDYIDDIKVGDKAPDGGNLRPFIVWFGEDVPKIEVAKSIVKRADIFVVIGTSLEVYPAAGLLDYVGYDVPVYLIDPKKPDVDIDVIHIQKKATEGVKELISILKEKDGQ